MIKKIMKYSSIAFCMFLLYCGFAPVEMPRYTLTDGKTTIVFQSMIHIARPYFYKNVESDIVSYKADGYKFLYEGVRPSKIPHKNDNAAGIPNYSLLAYLVGLTSQNDGVYFYMAEKLGSNADVDADYLTENFKKAGLIDDKPASESDKKDTSQPITKKDLETLYRLRPIISFIFLPVNRIGARFSVMEEYFSELTNTHDAEMEIIIVGRNKVLYSCVKDSNSDKIYINYGRAHFSNFYNLLKKDNSNWHIVEEKDYIAF
jgi:hypothetical protein